jgi:orotate phosphoribosyltransferase
VRRTRGGADVKAFFVRKETKQHGLQRRIEGPAARRRATGA